MGQIILVSAILLSVSLAGGANETETLTSIIEGQYQIHQQNAKAQTYLDCRGDQFVKIQKVGSDIEVEGVAANAIEFRDVNQGPVGMPGPLVGFSQRRTLLKSLDDNHIQLISEYRDCEPLLSKLGCFGKKWRTTAEFIFYVEDKDSIRQISAELKYQPFSSSQAETCSFERKTAIVD